MKFTVKNLLVITFLAALTINGCRTFNQLKERRSHHSRLDSQLQQYRPHTRNYQKKKLIFDRAFEASQNRKQDFAGFEEEFKQAVQLASQFEFDDKERIHARIIPTLQPRFGFCNRIRSWLPESHRFQLQLSYENHEGNPEQTGESKFFEAGKADEFQLKSGESIIEFQWTREAETTRVRLSINGALAHETSSSTAIKNFSRFGVASSSQNSYDLESRCLHGNSYYLDDGTNETSTETLLVFLIVSEKDEQAK